ncbi:MAG: hypothetical protein LUQ25_04550, partial [Methanoregulaceae archaeon]|nr:hypothetical protein [Methanoregulaceae archaeon]
MKKYLVFMACVLILAGLACVLPAAAKPVEQRTTVGLVSAPNPSVAGQLVTFMATVEPAPLTPTSLTVHTDPSPSVYGEPVHVTATLSPAMAGQTIT